MQSMADLRYALRGLLKNPGFTALAVLTIALGIGASSAIFSVLNGVVLRPLPYEQPERLAAIWTFNLEQNLPDGSSYQNFEDWRTRSREFEDMAMYIRPEFTRSTLTAGDRPERLQEGMVGPRFFRLLGAPALLGRTLEPEDFTRQQRVTVISYALWRTKFAAAADVVGREVEIDGARTQIVGVMPASFQLPVAATQVWRPLSVHPFWEQLTTNPNARRSDGLVVLGRLRAGTSLDAATAELEGISAQLREEHPRLNQGLGVQVTALDEKIVGGPVKDSLWLLFGAVGFVLLIACANVANLLLVRGALRGQEMALRAALGAGKGRLIRQLLTESALLAAVSGALGLGFAFVLMRLLRSWASGVLPRAESVSLDSTAVLYTVGVALVSGLLFGLFPALRLSTANTNAMLREGEARTLGGRGSRTLLGGLVVGEIALAVVLLSGAGLLVRSFERVESADRGYDSANVLLMQFDFPDGREGRHNYFYTESLRRIRALPGVLAAGAVSDFFIHRQPDYRIAVEGRPAAQPGDEAPPLTEDNTLPGYFEAMSVPLVEGRLFRETDLDEGAPPVRIINETMAQRFWPDEDPIGKRFKYGTDPASDQPWNTVVGVVHDMRRQRLDEAAIPFMFRPGAQTQMDIAIRTVGDPTDLAAAIRREIDEVDASVPPYGVTTVEQRLGETVGVRRLQTLLLGFLAASALVLAVIGIYGLVRQSVVARTREIGVRIALGASVGSVLRMVLGSALGLAVAGLTIGLLVAFGFARALASFLYETSPGDFVTYAGVAVLLLAVTAVAAIWPARRAARTDPATVLRQE